MAGGALADGPGAPGYSPGAEAGRLAPAGILCRSCSSSSKVWAARVCPIRFIIRSAACSALRSSSQAWNLAWFSEVGSNIFSNVPFVLVAGKWVGNFAEPELMWKVMALATTFAGNLTIVGSVANIIVVESRAGHPRSAFGTMRRYGDAGSRSLTSVVGHG